MRLAPRAFGLAALCEHFGRVVVEGKRALHPECTGGPPRRPFHRAAQFSIVDRFLKSGGQGRPPLQLIVKRR
ncbi:MAG: hypothetical protein DMF61_16210 [Blastocatellia bacterium AA13]|nr:MAG: hypothetical protein DMF61_16210 [Blastocatellia bacterium AA13]